MLPVILVAVGAYLIGDSVLEDSKKYAKGGEVVEPEWSVSITSEDGDTYDWVGFAKNEDEALYAAEKEAGFDSVESGINMITDEDGNEVEYAKGGYMADGGDIYSGKDIKITIPKMGKFDEQKVVAVYDKENFIFKIYDKDKKRVLTKMGGINFESNLMNGSYKMDGYMAKGGEFDKPKVSFEISIPYNFESVVKDEYDFVEFLSKTLTKKWFGSGVWGVKVTKKLFTKNDNQYVIVEVEIPLAFKSVDKFDIEELLSKTLTKKYFGNGIWGVKQVSKKEDGGYMAKGGKTDYSSLVLKYDYPKFKRKPEFTTYYKVDTTEEIKVGGRGEKGYRLLFKDGKKSNVVITKRELDDLISGDFKSVDSSGAEVSISDKY